MSQRPLLIAIPCYNCEKQIPRVLAELTPATLERTEKILIIDNRSTDGTVQAAIDAIKKLNLPRVEVIRNNENLGLGGSQKVGFTYAATHQIPWTCILHGDNQALSSEIDDLWAIHEAKASLDVVFGSRFSKGSRLEGYSFVRTWGNRALNLLYTLVSGRRMEDLGSGINLFRTASVYSTSLLGFADDFTFNIDLVLHLFRRRLPLVFHPITWREIDQVSNAKAIKVGFRSLVLLAKWRVGLKSKPSQPSPRYQAFQSLFSGGGAS